MSHSASQTAMGAFRAKEADIGRGRPAGFPEASGAGEAYARVAPTFCEFFAGGGMARAGLAPGWNCSVRQRHRPEESGGLRCQLGVRAGLIVGDVGRPDHGRSSRRRRPRLGVTPLPGSVARWRSRGARRRPLRLVLAVHETHAGSSRRGSGAAHDRDRKRLRLADVTWRQGLRRDLRCVGRRRLPLRRGGDRRCAVRPAVARARVHRRGRRRRPYPRRAGRRRADGAIPSANARRRLPASAQSDLVAPSSPAEAELRR